MESGRNEEELNQNIAALERLCDKVTAMRDAYYVLEKTNINKNKSDHKDDVDKLAKSAKDKIELTKDEYLNSRKQAADLRAINDEIIKAYIKLLGELTEKFAQQQNNYANGGALQRGAEKFRLGGLFKHEADKFGVSLNSSSSQHHFSRMLGLIIQGELNRVPEMPENVQQIFTSTNDDLLGLEDIKKSVNAIKFDEKKYPNLNPSLNAANLWSSTTSFLETNDEEETTPRSTGPKG